jgi:hypothetical protein
MEQLIPWLVFCLAFLVFCFIKPNGARIFVGIFFIVMALAVNLLLSFVAPQQFVAIGTDASLIPFYEWFFNTVVAAAPPVVGIAAAAGEIAVGFLILSHGRGVRWGLGGAIAFLILITPLGVWTLPNPLMAIGLVRLFAMKFPRSLWHQWARHAAG